MTNGPRRNAIRLAWLGRLGLQPGPQVVALGCGAVLDPNCVLVSLVPLSPLLGSICQAPIV